MRKPRKKTRTKKITKLKDTKNSTNEILQETEKTKKKSQETDKVKKKSQETEKQIKKKPRKRKRRKKLKKKIKILLKKMLISIIIIIVILCLFIINTKITLTGNKQLSLEVYNDYNEPGFKATFINIDITNKVKIKENIDTNKLGTYYITYKLPFPFLKTIKREISVKDTTKPTITLNGKETINIYVGETYKDESVTITDNYDKDLTKNLKVSNNIDTDISGTYEISYTVKDSSNNTSTLKRTINVKPKTIKTKSKKSCTYTTNIEKYICDNDYDISFGYYNINNESEYKYRNNTLYYGASLIKTVDALYLYDKNLITENLIPYVEKAITVSDNPAHQYLVKYIGREKLKQYGISLGAKNTLNGSDNFASTSVEDQIIYMKKLYEITKDNKNEQLKTFFLNTRKNQLLFEDSPLIMHKYGHYEWVYHNSGIVLDKNPYIVTILTNEGYNDYKTIISTISKMIYEYHLKTNKK